MGRVCRTMVVMGLGAVAAGLPLSLVVSPDELVVQTVAALAGSGNAVDVSEAFAVLPALQLFLDRGTLRRSGEDKAKPAQPTDELLLDGARFRIQLGRPGATVTDTKPDTSQSLLGQLVQMHLSGLNIRRSRLDIVTESDQTFTLTDISAEVAQPRRGSFTAKGLATFKSRAVHFEASWSAAATDSKSSRPAYPMKISLRAANLEANFEGRLLGGGDPRLSGAVDIRSKGMRDLARWFDLPVPMASDLKDGSIAGTLDWGEGRISFPKAFVVIDGNRGEGALLLRTTGPRPSIEGTIGFKTFDLAPFLASQMAADGKSADDMQAVGESIVAAFDTDLRLSAAKVMMPRAETGRAALTISVNQGRLLAGLAELEIEQGNAHGQLTLDVNGDVPRLGAKIRLTNVDPGRIFAEGVKRNPLLGRADIALDGHGSGTSLPRMLASFSGKGTMRLGGPGKLSLDLKALAYAAQKVDTVGWSAAGKGSTPLDEADGRFQISNGALTIESLAARSGPMSYNLRGKVDIQGRLLDLNLVMGTAGGSDAPGVGQDVLVLRGPWSDAAISLMGRPFTTSAPSVKGATMATPPLILPLPTNNR